jgi:archaemetzincin
MSKAAALVFCVLCVCMPPLFAAGGVTIEIVFFGESDPKVAAYLEERLGPIFNAQVEIGGALRLPAYAYNQKRRQYHSKAILDTLAKTLKTLPHRMILAVINKDLFVPGLNFVFGQAAPSQGVAIISLARLNQGFYGLPPDETLLVRRTLKEAVHELGHLVNLGHCSDPGCVMYFSNSLPDTDKKSYRFCEMCRNRLP